MLVKQHKITAPKQHYRAWLRNAGCFERRINKQRHWTGLRRSITALSQSQTAVGTTSDTSMQHFQDGNGQPLPVITNANNIQLQSYPSLELVYQFAQIAPSSLAEFSSSSRGNKCMSKKIPDPQYFIVFKQPLSALCAFAIAVSQLVE